MMVGGVHRRTNWPKRDGQQADPNPIMAISVDPFVLSAHVSNQLHSFPSSLIVHASCARAMWLFGLVPVTSGCLLLVVIFVVCDPT